MAAKTSYDGLDRFRLIAAVLVIAIHTGPLSSYYETADFWLTSIVARLAVPFFFMTSGFFLFRKQTLIDYSRRLAFIYFFSILLYAPVNWYSGYFDSEFSLFGLARDIVFDGTFYHLWYLPALLIGVYIVYWLAETKSTTLLFLATGSLYLIGLLGDSYFGMIAHHAPLTSAYSYMFAMFDYTRNGLFFAPVYIALGLWAARQPESTRQSASIYVRLFAVSMAGLFIEAIMVARLEWPRHDSMYVALLPAVYFLFRWLQLYKGSGKPYWRKASLWIYIVHPLAIVLVRGFAKWTGLQAVLIENSLLHFAAVVLLSFIMADAANRLTMRQTKEQPTQRAWSEIRLDHLNHNLAELRSALPSQCRLMAVVKADAYGHGAVRVAQRLNKAGVKSFAVAELSEGVALRKRGVKGDILVLGHTCPGEWGDLVKYKLQQTVISAEYGKLLSEYGKKIKVHIKLDTGMGRLGENCDHMEAILAMYRYDQLEVVGTYTHLAASDSLAPDDIIYTRTQISRFNQMIDALKAKGINPGTAHVQSSYGILNYSELNYGLARPGIALYGVLTHGIKVNAELDLRPVLSVRARVVMVRSVSEGVPVGYGRHYTAARDSQIATISIGYADGIPRSLSENGGVVLIRGQRANIIGKICMDHLMADVTHIDGVQYGDVATLIGHDGEEKISAEQVAKQCNTITNEILSRIGSRVRRSYI